MAFEALSDVERTDLARRHLDGLESWLRRLVDFKLRGPLGAAYLTQNSYLKQDRRTQIAARVRQMSTPREADATTLGQLIVIIANGELYKQYFRRAFEEAFPQGLMEFKEFADRLVGIRNELVHGRPCSSRQLERAICYSNDISESIAHQFQELGVGNEYDVPLIVRYVDSLGNSSTLEDVPSDMGLRIIDWRRGQHGDLRPGMIFSAEVEVDPTFESAGFEVSWYLFGTLSQVGSKAKIEVSQQNVGEQFELIFEVKTDRLWHRSYGLDDRLAVIFRVLPPV